VTVATKQYVEAYYSQPIDIAYFDGCSTGGRQSMVEGTHYPVDCDGLIVGDPAIAYHSGRTSTFKQAKAFIPTRHGRASAAPSRNRRCQHDDSDRRRRPGLDRRRSRPVSSSSGRCAWCIRWCRRVSLPCRIRSGR
jgi:hypothetical protein